MHLINAKEYNLECFVGNKIPPYAILSHVWEEGEVLFQDMRDLPSACLKKGFIKIRYTCQQAVADGLSYAWVDTCCINKESSAELSEAINSMFNWYQRATSYYAYLSDLQFIKRRSNSVDPITRPRFSQSKWFTRGWTLQELIAPEEVHFMDHDWKLIGSKKKDLAYSIANMTGVDIDVLWSQTPLQHLGIAQRMSWAAERVTTRVEDHAYCLLGIFDINMRLLYGEGEKAFHRLQEELLRKSTDQSILAHERRNLLADSPLDFRLCADMKLYPHYEKQPHEMTSVGLSIRLPYLELYDQNHNRFQPGAALNCRNRDFWLVLRLERLNNRSDGTIFELSKSGSKFEFVELGRLLSAKLTHDNQVACLPHCLPLRLLLTSHSSRASCSLTYSTFKPIAAWHVAVPGAASIRSQIQEGSMLAVFHDNLRESVGSINFELLDNSASLRIPLRLGFSLDSIIDNTKETPMAMDWCVLSRTGSRSRTIRDERHLKPGQSVALSLPLEGWRIRAALEALPWETSHDCNEFLLKVDVADASEQ